MSPEKPRRLGRGLEALFAARPGGVTPVEPPLDAPLVDGTLQSLAVARIRPNPMQPRKEFAQDDLRELEASIRANGLLQPIIVRAAGEWFEIIAGERRFRAVQRLGWHDVPAVVRRAGEVGDKQALTLALVENLQRADLNPIEEADGYQNLVAQFSLTQQQVADLVGKDRSTIANTLRLLALPPAVRNHVRTGALSLGHARALLGIAEQAELAALAATIIRDGLSVREVERRVREGASGRVVKSGPAIATRRLQPEVAHIEQELRRRLQTDVRVRLRAKDRGELRISFYSADDLERLLDLLLGAAREAR